MSVIAVDTETTGLSPLLGHRIIEIGAVRMENRMISESFHSLINCGRPISKVAERVHFITDDMLSGQPPPESVFKEFRSFIGNSLLVAHNARFDRSFLSYEFSRLGWRFQNRMMCTLKMSRRLLPDLPDYRLEAVAKHLLGSSAEDIILHRALEDAKLVARIWLALEQL